MNELSGTIYGTKRLEFSTTWDLGEASTSWLGLGVLAAQPTNPQCRIDERVRDESTSIFYFFLHVQRLLVLHFTIELWSKLSWSCIFVWSHLSHLEIYSEKFKNNFHVAEHTKSVRWYLNEFFSLSLMHCKTFRVPFHMDNKQGGDEVAECNAIFRRSNYNVFSSVTTDMDFSYYFRFSIFTECRIFFPTFDR